MANDDPPLSLDDAEIPAEVLAELNDHLDAYEKWYRQQVLKAIRDGQPIIINDEAYPARTIQDGEVISAPLMESDDE